MLNKCKIKQFIRECENATFRIDELDLLYKTEEEMCLANMKRDMGIFKKLQDSFTVAEILLMIEFIFSGDQTYLDIHTTHTV